ncbi:MAG TPA: LysE family transporter [Burkholderiaceae bacterium]|nr:LysE family transporter [Burkholderiaceae bacterium]
MLGISDYWAFVATVLVFLMLPGPGTFAVLTSSAKGGARGGYAALAGLMIGDWLLMLAAIVGVAAILTAHPMLFRSVQWLGVAYLVWVGTQLLRASGKVNATPLPIAPGTYFRQGFLITLINPKAIVFYMAFFPLFIDPARYRGLGTLLAMGSTISLLTLAYGSALIVGGNWAARRLRANAAVSRWMSRFAGVALIGFGARLAAE